MRNPATEHDPAVEATETREWLDSLDYVLQTNGVGRAAQLLRQLDAHARQTGARLPFSANTPYVNTIPVAQQPPFPGQPADRAPDQEPRALERPLHGGPSQQAQ